MESESVRRSRQGRLIKAFQKRFDRLPELAVQAPGRVDLIGSHTDYNQGFVLTQAIDRNTWIAARPRRDRRVHIASMNVSTESEFHLDDIAFDEVAGWANYVRGVAAALRAEGLPLTGFDGLVHSTIPFGSGLSSSAALEVASAVLFQELADWTLDPVQLALLCQQAENEFVGVRSGILDQYSSIMGQANRLMLLDCRALSSRLVKFPEDGQIVICDTGKDRALADSAYTQRRSQCEQGVSVLQGRFPQVRALRDASLAQLEAVRNELAPVVYDRCRFIIEENERVQAVAELLEMGDLGHAGELMGQSFSGADELYGIVTPEMRAMHAAIGQAPGGFGGRGAGAGFGGCLVALVARQATDEFMDSVRCEYQARTGILAEVFPVRAAAGAGALKLEV